MSVIDGHQFSMATKTLQAMAVESALQKAEECKIQNGALSTAKWTTAKCGRFSKHICENAYRSFGEKLSEKFPSEAYRTLIDLTLKSRTNFFFFDLQNQVKESLLKRDSVISSSLPLKQEEKGSTSEKIKV